MASVTSSELLKPRHRFAWLFSPTVDLWVFLGSAVVSLLLVAAGAFAGLLEQPAPEWTWISTVLLIDVAHVYATGFRVYFDPAELRRRPWLYGGVPVLAWLAGIAVYALGDFVFWRCLAYLAVFHFVRQQYGWMALYRRKAGERGSRWLDTLAIYLATGYPLLWWHAASPREFVWFMRGDFVTASEGTAWLSLVVNVVAGLYWLTMTAYAVHAFRQYWQGRGNPGKDIVLLTTAVCWYVGIVALNSDFAFTVTNVIIHGVPYMALVFWHWRKTQELRVANAAAPENVPGYCEPPAAHETSLQESQRRSHSAIPAGTAQKSAWLRPLVVFVATVWLLAFCEELWWDRAVYHDRGWLFGSPLEMTGWHGLLVPLLAVPQFTHYLLDGFIWRRRNNPETTQLTAQTPRG